MHTSFRFVALPHADVAPLFDADAATLAARHAAWREVDASPGFPCRLTLDDAHVGERVLLLPYVHHAVASPYRASGPVFVRRVARAATFDVGEVPPAPRRRLLSLRAYDIDGCMVAADVVEGARVESAIGKMFARRDVDVLHAHYAKPGCFAARIERA